MISTSALAQTGLPIGLPAAPAWKSVLTAPPDFSGVYRINLLPESALLSGTGLPGPRSPNLDGSEGRPNDLPPLNLDYEAKYWAVAKARQTGRYDDPEARCEPPGMPRMMDLPEHVRLEIVQSKDQVEMRSTWLNAKRRIAIDGGPTTAPLRSDLTAGAAVGRSTGKSTGHWEGDTLVIETVGLRDDTATDRYGSLHSDAMTIKERIRLITPNVLEDRFTVTDDQAYTRPWTFVRSYRKVGPGDDELKELACAPSLVKTR